MVNLNRSFLYGICFASLTWIISLYLYFQITSSENSTNKSEFTIWTQEQILSKTQIHKTATSQNINTLNNQNSPELIKKLTPIKRKKVELDDGKLVLNIYCNIEYLSYTSQN